MNYAEARAAHAAGAHVTCGYGVKSGAHRWQLAYDRPEELISNAWRTVTWADVIASAPGRNPAYVRAESGIYRPTGAKIDLAPETHRDTVSIGGETMSTELPAEMFAPAAAAAPTTTPAYESGPGPSGAIVVETPKKTRAKKAPAGTGAATAAITPELAADLERKREFYAETLREIQGAPTDSQEQCQQLVDVAAKCKTEKDLITEQKESITKPLNAALTAARRLFDPPIQFLNSCEAAIKGKLNERLNQQRIDQARALAAVAQGGGRADTATMAVATGAGLVAAPEGSYEVETWHAEITDATLLPAPYWMPNMEMLQDMAKRQKSQAQVAGVRFFSTKSLAIRKEV